MNRIGFGYDVHRLVDGRKLIIGGVEIPFEKGLLGHSDADVLLHAICDALLGAAALGDIGKHFPDTEQQYKNISSLELLKHTSNLLRNHGYTVVNIDSTLVLEKPKILPYVDQMRMNISQSVGIDLTAVSVKATTNENLGFIGSGEGASAYAVTLINSK
ncbi:MAG: 2-C-methyl-D-erythritol 2,4-cyclodiphosphate synthase [Ignavibacteriales bacterium]|nr:2-C-methyl-D-erythritol 2,4-cyclodiphosphate synthase [Ignavibacteriales bacterium]